MKILVSCPQGKNFDMFFTRENIALAEELGQAIWNMGTEAMTKKEVKKLIRDCDVYVTYWDSPRLDEDILSAAHELKVLLHLGGSISQMACQKAYERGICVLCGEAYYAASAAEGTLAYILSAVRNIPEHSARIKYKNDWRHSWDKSCGLVGKTVGIVNYGSVSEKLAELLAPFEVKTLIYDKLKAPSMRKRRSLLESVSLDTLCMRSDIIVVYTPNHNQGYNMLSADCLKYIKKGALLVDVSKGGVVNKSALYRLLLNNRISAVLDMYEQDFDKNGRSLLFMNNLTVMPHISGPTADVREVVARQLLKECADYINEGKAPKHRVKPNGSCF